MDPATKRVLLDYAINPDTVPPGAVRLLGIEDIALLGERPLIWARDPANNPALAFSVDSEHTPHTGIILRNLKTGSKKSIHTITRGIGPYWHNFHHALPQIYAKGVVVLVEGPKDVLVLVGRGLPAVAYLGIAPGEDHLKVIKRYASAVLWIPDTDFGDARSLDRRRKVTQNATRIDLPLIEIPIPTKDPGELAYQPAYLDSIYSRYRELTTLV